MVYDLVNVRTGKKGPVEVAVSVGANADIDLKAGTWWLVPKAQRNRPLHLNHFATCPQRLVWGRVGVH